MANYIVALAHFCELHGPVSIICTQQTHENVHQTSYLLPGNSKVQTCASCKLVLPQDAINLITNARRSSGATEEIDNEKYLRRSMARPKLLVELTGDDQIFVRLHMWAREVLRDVQMKD